MDPNEVYKEITNLITDLTYEENDGKDLDESTLEFMKLFDALDYWLQAGGFLPDAWKRSK